MVQGMARMDRSGEASSSAPIFVALTGGPTSATSLWRVAMPRCAKYGVRDWRGCRRRSGTISLEVCLCCSKCTSCDRALVSSMMARGVNTVMTSSCGRLFDAVASIIGLRQEVTFEGQAAIELEMATEPGVEDGYSFEIDASDVAQIDMRATIREIVRDVKSHVAIGIIASRFHNTVATVICEMCRRIREGEGLNRVCLSGGTFQNMYLLERAVSGLRRLGFEVYVHSAVPPNDGGISLGQAMIANKILNSGA